MLRGSYDVRRWDEATGVMVGGSLPSIGAFSGADTHLVPNDFCSLRVVSAHVLERRRDAIDNIPMSFDE